MSFDMSLAKSSLFPYKITTFALVKYVYIP